MLLLLISSGFVLPNKSDFVFKSYTQIDYYKHSSFMKIESFNARHILSININGIYFIPSTICFTTTRIFSAFLNIIKDRFDQNF